MLRCRTRSSTTAISPFTGRRMSRDLAVRPRAAASGCILRMPQLCSRWCARKVWVIRGFRSSRRALDPARRLRAAAGCRRLLAGTPERGRWGRLALLMFGVARLVAARLVHLPETFPSTQRVSTSVPGASSAKRSEPHAVKAVLPGTFIRENTHGYGNPKQDSRPARDRKSHWKRQGGRHAGLSLEWRSRRSGRARHDRQAQRQGRLRGDELRRLPRHRRRLLSIAVAAADLQPAA